MGSCNKAPDILNNFSGHASAVIFYFQVLALRIMSLKSKPYIPCECVVRVLDEFDYRYDIIGYKIRSQGGEYPGMHAERYADNVGLIVRYLMCHKLTAPIPILLCCGTTSEFPTLSVLTSGSLPLARQWRPLLPYDSFSVFAASIPKLPVPASPIFSTLKRLPHRVSRSLQVLPSTMSVEFQV